jgi:hypothetical protein
LAPGQLDFGVVATPLWLSSKSSCTAPGYLKGQEKILLWPGGHWSHGKWMLGCRLNVQAT